MFSINFESEMITEPVSSEILICEILTSRYMHMYRAIFYISNRQCLNDRIWFFPFHRVKNLIRLSPSASAKKRMCISANRSYSCESSESRPSEGTAQHKIG